MIIPDFREKIFQTSVVESPGADLSDPRALGLLTSRSVTSVQLPAPDGGHIGAWLMTPDQPQPGGDNTDQALAQAVLCVHGVKGNRSRSYRCDLYEFLLDKGFQVLLIKYDEDDFQKESSIGTCI